MVAAMAELGCMYTRAGATDRRRIFTGVELTYQLERARSALAQHWEQVLANEGMRAVLPQQPRFTETRQAIYSAYFEKAMAYLH